MVYVWGMSTETPVQTPVTAALGGLTDLVEKYGLPQDMPAADWLLYLNLERPRKTICCLSWRTRVLKRTFDLVVASTMFVLLLPVMAMVALADRSRGRESPALPALPELSSTVRCRRCYGRPC